MLGAVGRNPGTPYAAPATGQALGGGPDPYRVDRAIANVLAQSEPEPPEPAPITPAPLPSGPAATGATLVAQPTEAVPTAPEPAPEPEPTPQPTPARRTYTNPVFAADAPDPAIVRGEDGTFFAYTTEVPGQPFQILKSTDLTSWTAVGPAFTGTGPEWIAEHRWAPDVQRTGDHYTMTYSGRGHDGNMRIGYATSPTPEGPFTDRGVLIESNSGGYNIDPHLKQVGDQWMLYYGSTGGTDAKDQTGITAQPVAIAGDGTIKPSGTGNIVLPETGERELVEAPWVHEREGMYYMFYSDGKWDAKGGSDDYALKVARSSSPNGPFEKLGAPIIQQGSGYTSTGHNAIITDDAGKDWMLYHGWGADHSKGRMLMLDPIEWKDGWPVVNGGAGPSANAIDAPVIAARDGAAALA